MFAARKTDGAVAAGPATYIEDVFSTYLYTGNGATQVVNNGIPLGSTTYISLVGRTITNLGGTFGAPYVIGNLNDNIAEISNATNVGFVAQPSYLDVYVDLGAAAAITSYLIAPQGSRDSGAFNTPKDFIVKASNDASTWTTIATFTSISSGYPNWNAGTFRSFTFSNTTAYRYWRLQNTSFGDAGSGVSISEWMLGMPVTTTGNEGLIWIKSRSAATDHALYDTTRGATFDLVSNSSAAQTTQTSGLTTFNGNGFTVSSLAKLNTNAATYASWTFRKQAKFFDVVTWTGNGTGNRTIPHSLGSTPGFIQTKRTDAAESWWNHHRSVTSPNANWWRNYGTLSTTNAFSDWGDNSGLYQSPDATNLYIGSFYNASGKTYVAYLFAHDAGGFGATGSDNVISCGSYTGNGSATGPTVTLGYEPQFLILKAASGGTSGSQDWNMVDNMRGWTVSSNAQLNPNLSAAETQQNNVALTSTGFRVTTAGADFNGNGNTYIYIAIRRGPMKTPTSGTSVFSPVARTGTSAAATMTAGFAPDAVFLSNRDRAYTNSNPFYDKLRGNNAILSSNNTGAEQNLSGSITQYTNTGITLGSDAFGNINGSGGTYINWIFQRAPGFFDVVCDTGTASAHTITHGLTVVPELMIRKKRNSATNSDWVVWHTAFTGTTKYLYLNSTAAEDNNSAFWTSTAPTSTVFSVGTGSRVNNTGDTYVTYLFASVNGVSKVGSYTGNGSSQTINCGFAAGARFILIKRTSSTGDWYVWDTARGIVSGNDPRLSLNTTAAEVTTDDSIDPDNSGFIVNQLAATNINVNAATYIYLAIA